MNRPSDEAAFEIADAELDEAIGGTNDLTYGHAGAAYDNAQLGNRLKAELSSTVNSGHTGMQGGFKKVSRNIMDYDARGALSYPDPIEEEGPGG